MTDNNTNIITSNQSSFGNFNTNTIDPNPAISMNTQAEVDNDSMLDCSIVESPRHKDYHLISTTDFFYPLVSDPYIQGRIGASNVLSDIYSLGISNIDNVLMILGASNLISNTENQRNNVTKEMIRGFVDTCKVGNTHVTGGHSVINPWPIIGGVAQSICLKNEFIEPYNGDINNCLLLTKPLGTQVAVNMHEWYLFTKIYNLLNQDYNNSSNPKLFEENLNKFEKYERNFNKLLNESGIFDNDNNTNYNHSSKNENNKNENKNKNNTEKQRLDEYHKVYNIAVGSMMRLNMNAAILMNSDKYKKHINGCTDITGFGILGHGRNLARYQNYNKNTKNGIQFVIDKLPIIKNVFNVDKYMNINKILNGIAAETSGGLLIMFDNENIARQFSNDLLEIDGWPSWIVGYTREYPRGVKDSQYYDNDAAIIDDNNLQIIEVD